MGGSLYEHIIALCGCGVGDEVEYVSWGEYGGCTCVSGFAFVSLFVS